MNKYKFAKIEYHWKREKERYIGYVALMDQNELEIVNDSEEDAELLFYFDGYEDFLSAFIPDDRNGYDFVIDNIISLYEDF